MKDLFFFFLDPLKPYCMGLEYSSQGAVTLQHNPRLKEAQKRERKGKKVSDVTQLFCRNPGTEISVLLTPVRWLELGCTVVGKDCIGYVNK